LSLDEPLVSHSPVRPLEPDVRGGTASCASVLDGVDSVEVPGALVPCWPCEWSKSLCGFQLFGPQSPISPLEPEIGGDAVSAAAGKMRNANKRKAVAARPTHLKGTRKAKRGILTSPGPPCVHDLPDDLTTFAAEGAVQRSPSNAAPKASRSCDLPSRLNLKHPRPRVRHLA
jgi:hypothetical protein